MDAILFEKEIWVTVYFPKSLVQDMDVNLNYFDEQQISELILGENKSNVPKSPSYLPTAHATTNWIRDELRSTHDRVSPGNCARLERIFWVLILKIMQKFSS